MNQQIAPKNDIVMVYDLSAGEMGQTTPFELISSVIDGGGGVLSVSKNAATGKVSITMDTSAYFSAAASSGGSADLIRGVSGGTLSLKSVASGSLATVVDTGDELEVGVDLNSATFVSTVADSDNMIILAGGTPLQISLRTFLEGLPASATQRGTSRMATSAEAFQGVLDDASVSPLALMSADTTRSIAEKGMAGVTPASATEIAALSATESLAVVLPNGGVRLVPMSQVVALANHSRLTDNGDGTFTHNNGYGANQVVDLPQEVADHANSAQALAITQRGIDQITNASVAEVAALSSADKLLVGISGGGYRRIPLDGLPGLGGAKSALTDNGDGTITHTDGDGATTSIDMAAEVSANATGAESFDLVKRGLNTAVNISAAELAALTNGEGIPVELGSGAVRMIPLSSLPKSALTDNGNGTFTHTDGVGGSVTVNMPNSRLTDNGDGTITHIDGDGATTSIDMAAEVSANATGAESFDLVKRGLNTAVNISAAELAALTNGEGIPVELGSGAVRMIPLSSLPKSALTDNGNGTFTHTDGVGGSVTVNMPNSRLTDNGDGTITHIDGDGATTSIDMAAEVSANATGAESFDLVKRGLNTAVNISAAELAALTNGEGIPVELGSGAVRMIPLSSLPKSALTDNGNGTFTHTDGVGGSVTVNMPNSRLTDNGDGTITHIDGDGATTTVNMPNLVATYANGAQAFALLKRGFDQTVDASTPEIAAFTGNERLMIELAGGGMRQIEVIDVPFFVQKTGDTMTGNLTLPNLIASSHVVAAGDVRGDTIHATSAYTPATLPAAALSRGRMAYITGGLGGGQDNCMVFCDGANWRKIQNGAIQA